MDYALQERIGNPDLFTGRKAELDYFLKWISDIKERKSQSTAMLARRKMGKTAIMERLFNITFYKNDGNGKRGQVIYLLFQHSHEHAPAPAPSTFFGKFA